MTTSPELSLEVVPPSELGSADYASALYQGRGKTGKTYNALTWPSVAAIVFDRNLATYELFEKDPDLPTPQIIKHRGVDDVRERVMQLLKQGKVDAETIVLDSLSFFSEDLADSIMKKRDSYGTGQGQAASVRLRRFVADLLSLTSSTGLPRNYNVVVTVHDAPTGGEEDGPRRIEPVTIGKMREAVARYFDIVLLTEKVREYKTVPGKPAEGSDRYFVRSASPDAFRVAGGTLWGKQVPDGVEGTYPSLRRACGLED